MEKSDWLWLCPDCCNYIETKNKDKHINQEIKNHLDRIKLLKKELSNK